MAKEHKANPGKHTVSRERLIEVLAPFDKSLPKEDRDKLWAARAEAISKGVRWFLADYALPGTRYNNSDLCRAIGQCVDLPLPEQHTISRVISWLGKQEEFKPHIRPGRTMTNRGNGGSKVQQRVRDWFAVEATAEEAEEIHKEFHDGKTILETAEEAQMEAAKFLMRAGWDEKTILAARPGAAPMIVVPADDSIQNPGLRGAEFVAPTGAEKSTSFSDNAQPEHKPLQQELSDARELLESIGYKVLEPGTVQGVDIKKFSKHPSPGAARVDCGECGGTGKLYMKQEQK